MAAECSLNLPCKRKLIALHYDVDSLRCTSAETRIVVMSLTSAEFAVFAENIAPAFRLINRVAADSETHISNRTKPGTGIVFSPFTGATVLNATLLLFSYMISFQKNFSLNTSALHYIIVILLFSLRKRKRYAIFISSSF